MPRMLKLTLCGLVLLLPPFALTLGFGLAASAQGPDLTLTQATLRLWPEYDDPGLLVILSGTFTGTATFPQQVAFPIPANARGVQATQIDATGGLLSQPWQIVNGKLTYTLPGPQFQIEYYVDRPQSGNQRDLTYAFQTPYAIGSLQVAVQQPARATAFSMTPQPNSSVQGSDGFTYYLIDRTNLPADENLTYDIRYTKTDEGLSVAQTSATATGIGSATAAAPAATARGLTGWLPYAMVGVGLMALVGAGIYWFVQMRPSQQLAPNKAGAQQPVRARPSARPTTPSKAVFCTQCGHQLAPTDRFCSQCGTPRRN